jgi:lysyl oxidase
MRKRLFGLHALALGAALALTALSASRASAQAVELRPNLQPFPAFDLAVSTNFSTGGKQLMFSTRSWNKGLGPLELVAGGVNAGGQDVYQRVYSSDGTFQDYFAGTFVWHPAHNHFHFGKYALYSLEPMTANGGVPKNGNKTTFCVMDTNKIDGTLPGAPATAVYSVCGDTIQGMSVGWADTYSSFLEGQSLDITGNPSGDYCLTIQIDPDSRLLEMSEADNSVSSLLRIDMEQSKVTVLNATSCTPATSVQVAGVSPSSGSIGSTVPVTITGSGFTSGIGISLEGGSGPAPTVSSVFVESATTIRATITVKKGKPGKDPVWDLRVGSGLLFGGFTVLP